MGLDWDGPAIPSRQSSPRAPSRSKCTRGTFVGRVHRDRSLGHLKAGRGGSRALASEANKAIALFADDVAAWRRRRGAWA